jgi:hypothetical protein
MIGLFAFMAGLIFVAITSASRTAKVLGAGSFRLFAIERPSSSLAKELAIRAAAVLAPFVLVMGAFVVAHLVGGDPLATTTVTVRPGPAKEAGMQTGDRVVEIDERPIATWEELRTSFGVPNATHRVVVERAGRRTMLSVTANAAGRIAIESQHEQRPVAWTSALAKGVTAPFNVLAATLTNLFRSSGKAEIETGPGIVRSAGQASGEGLAASLGFFAIVGAYLWPAFLVAHLLDAATLPAFRRRYSARHGDASSPAELVAKRITRSFQVFNVLLMICVLLLLAWISLRLLGARMEYSALFPLAWLSPLSLPLTWQMGSLLWGRRIGALCVVALLVPFFNLTVLVVLWIVARARLKEQGVANAGLVPPASPAG